MSKDLTMLYCRFDLPRTACSVDIVQYLTTKFLVRLYRYAHDFISTGIRPAAPGEAPIQGHSFILSTEVCFPFENRQRE